MDKNIAAILREDTKTVSVSFSEGNDQWSRGYTFVTNLDVAIGDTVVVPVGADKNLKLARVVKVDSDLEIEPNASTKFSWVAAKVDLAGYEENMRRNTEIETLLAKTYRLNARQAYAQQFLLGAAPEVMALVKGEATK